MHGAPATASVKSMTMTYYMHPPGLIRSGGVVVDAFACCRVTIASRAATSPTASPSPSPMAAVVPGEAAEACPCRCDCRLVGFPQFSCGRRRTRQADRGDGLNHIHPPDAAVRSLPHLLDPVSSRETEPVLALECVTGLAAANMDGTWPRSSFRKHFGS